ncbi:MAG: class I SAM-dependent methyltransferase [Gemmatimonadota bacterium]|jgi:SAM-dependent methyltransferase
MVGKTAEIGVKEYLRRSPRRPVLAFGVVPAYRRYELRLARYQDMVPAVRDLSRSGEVLEILDVGSGTGPAKRFIDHAGVAAHWTGIEIHPDRIELCRQLGYDRIIDDHDLERGPLPMSVDSFDVVIASHVLEHLENASAALEDWMRVLRPGGLLILGVPMHLPPVAKLARARFRYRGRKRTRAHCHFFSMRSLNELLRPYPVSAIRGFRLISARKWLPLEDYRWFYLVNRKIGRRFPALAAEVNVEIRKPLK